MRYLYTILLYFATPFLVLRLFWKSRKNPAYRQRWWERFGFFTWQPQSQCLWLHAVSLGESIAAVPLITALIEQYPDYAITVTTTTPTGAQFIQKKFDTHVQHIYAPFDLPSIIRRFLQKLRPVKMIIMETELWPNLLLELQRAEIPVMIANARLSEKSFAKYQRAKRFFKPLLQSIKMVAAQSENDGQRFAALGVLPQCIMITGNIKFDQTIPASVIEQAKILRQHWQARPTWIAASTHSGEETEILAALALIRQQFPHTLLIIAPRHPERFQSVADLCKSNNYTLARRSQHEIPCTKTAIYLADTTGELLLLYAASDVAFVGGSLIPMGGHNLIEPASLGLPIISGPHLHNFTTIRDLLLHQDGLLLVNNAKELAQQVMQLFKNQALRQQRGARAWRVSEQNRGALAKHLHWIQGNH